MINWKSNVEIVVVGNQRAYEDLFTTPYPPASVVNIGTIVTPIPGREQFPCVHLSVRKRESIASINY